MTRESDGDVEENEPARPREAPAQLRLRLKYADLASFVERFAPNVSRGGVFLATRAPRPVGAHVRFELVLADGVTRVLRGEGAVTWVRTFDPTQPSRPHGMGLRFTRLDADSRAMLERIEAWKRDHEEASRAATEGDDREEDDAPDTVPPEPAVAVPAPALPRSSAFPMAPARAETTPGLGPLVPPAPKRAQTVLGTPPPAPPLAPPSALLSVAANVAAAFEDEAVIASVPGALRRARTLSEFQWEDLDPRLGSRADGLAVRARADEAQHRFSTTPPLVRASTASPAFEVEAVPRPVAELSRFAGRDELSDGIPAPLAEQVATAAHEATAAPAEAAGSTVEDGDIPDTSPPGGFASAHAPLTEVEPLPPPPGAPAEIPDFTIGVPTGVGVPSAPLHEAVTASYAAPESIQSAVPRATPPGTDASYEIEIEVGGETRVSAEVPGTDAYLAAGSGGGDGEEPRGVDDESIEVDVAAVLDELLTAPDEAGPPKTVPPAHEPAAEPTRKPGFFSKLFKK